MSHQNYPRAVRNVTFVGDDNPAVPGAKSMTAILDVTVVPGVDTVQLVIEGKDPVLNKYYTVLSAAARVAVGTDVLTIGLGNAVTANQSANAPVPQMYRARVVHSAGTNFTYGLSIREG